HRGRSEWRRRLKTVSADPMSTVRSGALAAAIVPFGFRPRRKLRQHALRLAVFCQHPLETAVQLLGEVRPLFETGKQHRRRLDGGQTVAARLAAQWPVT